MRYVGGDLVRRIAKNFDLDMKINFLCLPLAAMLAAGCAAPKAPVARHPAPPVSTAIVTPDVSPTAKVLSVNATARYVVLNFPAGQLPKLQSTLFVYRDGVKVAEIKITGPQDGNNTVADLISGDAMPGDAVRDE